MKKVSINQSIKNRGKYKNCNDLSNEKFYFENMKFTILRADKSYLLRYITFEMPITDDRRR